MFVKALFEAATRTEARGLRLVVRGITVSVTAPSTSKNPAESAGRITAKPANSVCLYADHAIIPGIWPAYFRIRPAQLTSALERKS